MYVSPDEEQFPQPVRFHFDVAESGIGCAETERSGLRIAEYVADGGHPVAYDEIGLARYQRTLLRVRQQ